MRWRKIEIDGAFGDKKVLLTSAVVERPRGVVLLFHGVHSNADSTPGNKYARIASALAEAGWLPVMAETSRMERDRARYAGDPLGWILAAFRGKTYLQELQDCFRAYCAVKDLYPRLPLILWGFSLGGLNALLIAGGQCTAGAVPDDIEGLILCGSGDSVYAENQEIFKLPILSTLKDMGELQAAARKISASWCRVFRGSEDATFPSDACRRIFDSLAVKDKTYTEIDGSDHSFRLLHGEPSLRPLKEVYSGLDRIFP